MAGGRGDGRVVEVVGRTVVVRVWGRVNEGRVEGRVSRQARRWMTAVGRPPGAAASTTRCGKVRQGAVQHGGVCVWWRRGSSGRVEEGSSQEGPVVRQMGDSGMVGWPRATTQRPAQRSTVRYSKAWRDAARRGAGATRRSSRGPWNSATRSSIAYVPFGCVGSPPAGSATAGVPPAALQMRVARGGVNGVLNGAA